MMSRVPVSLGQARLAYQATDKFRELLRFVLCVLASNPSHREMPLKIEDLI